MGNSVSPGRLPAIEDHLRSAPGSWSSGRRSGRAESHAGHDGAQVRVPQPAGVGDQLGQAAEYLGDEISEDRGPRADGYRGEVRGAAEPPAVEQVLQESPGGQVWWHL